MSDKINSRQDENIQRPKDAPEWWDCVWRREACGQNDCPLCGRVNRQRQKHLEQGKDPDSMEAVMEDVYENFSQVGEMLKADAEKMGIDWEEIEEDAQAEAEEEEFDPEETELGKRIRDWRLSLHELTQASRDKGAAWPGTEAGRNLFWYSNTLLVKTYRQIDSRMGGDECVDLDYKYNRYVLKECLDILSRSLRELEEMDPERKNQFRMAALYLDGFRGDVLGI